MSAVFVRCDYLYDRETLDPPPPPVTNSPKDFSDMHNSQERDVDVRARLGIAPDWGVCVSFRAKSRQKCDQHSNLNPILVPVLKYGTLLQLMAVPELLPKLKCHEMETSKCRPSTP